MHVGIQMHIPRCVDTGMSGSDAALLSLLFFVIPPPPSPFVRDPLSSSFLLLSLGVSALCPACSVPLVFFSFEVLGVRSEGLSLFAFHGFPLVQCLSFWPGVFLMLSSFSSSVLSWFPVSPLWSSEVPRLLFCLVFPLSGNSFIPVRESGPKSRESCAGRSVSSECTYSGCCSTLYCPSTVSEASLNTGKNIRLLSRLQMYSFAQLARQRDRERNGGALAG